MTDPEYNLNIDGSYMSEDQIFLDIIGFPRIGQDMVYILIGVMTFGDIEKHFAMEEFGRWIRNSYGLWREDNPHVVLNPEPNAEGIVDHPLFPDNLSGRVMDRLKEYYLQNPVLPSSVPLLGTD